VGVNSSFLKMPVAVGAVVMASLIGVSSAAAAPSVDSEWASSVTEHDATLNAQINPNGAAASYFFEIDTIRSDNFTHPNCPFGPCASITVGPPLPSGLIEPPLEEIPPAAGQSVSVDMVRIGATLEPGTTYFYRVVAHEAFSDSSPTVYGVEQSFTTLSPDVVPEPAQNSAVAQPSLTNLASHHRRHKHRRHRPGRHLQTRERAVR
jgi:hypothetical protein